MKNYYLSLILILLCGGLVPVGSTAQVLLVWEFTGAAGNEAQGIAAAAPDISAAAPSRLLTRGAGLQPNATVNSFSSTDWGSNRTFDAGSTDYLEFTIAPTAGHALTLTRVDFYWVSSANGPQELRLTSSLDNHTTPIGSYAVPDENSNLVQFPLMAIDFTNLNQSVTFRIYGFDAAKDTGIGRLSGVGPDLVIRGTAVNCGITSAGPVNIVCLSSSINPNTDMVRLEIPYTGLDGSATVSASKGMGGAMLTVGGDDPASVSGGIIEITGLMEGEEYLVSIENGTCNYTFSGVVPANLCTVPCSVKLEENGVAITCNAITANPDNVTISVPYTAAQTGLTVTTDPPLTITGYDDMVGGDGTLTITGATEGQTYTVTLTDGSNCRTDAIITVPADLCTSLPDRPLINEFHYNDKEDSENFVELAIPLSGPFSTVPKSDIEVLLYDAAGNMYLSTPADMEMAPGTPAQGYQFYVWKPGDLVDGVGGIALVVEGVVLEFLSYGGTIIAVNGLAGGLTSTVIGPTEDSNTDPNTSIQRQGDCTPNNISCPDGLFWVGGIAETSSFINVSEFLPITLRSFTAAAEGKAVVLDWITANEQDNDYFAIERSAEGRVFTTIGEVPGAGTDEAENRYTFTDEAPLPGRSYYRLRQVDFDGTTAYYGPIAVDFAGRGPAPVRVYPNPQRGDFVTLEGELRSGTRISLLDVAGRVLRHWSVAETELRRELPLGRLDAGVYFLRLEDGRDVRTVRFVRQ
jgi:hypothetical protein